MSGSARHFESIEFLTRLSKMPDIWTTIINVEGDSSFSGLLFSKTVQSEFLNFYHWIMLTKQKMSKLASHTQPKSTTTPLRSVTSSTPFFFSFKNAPFVSCATSMLRKQEKLFICWKKDKEEKVILAPWSLSWKNQQHFSSILKTSYWSSSFSEEGSMF